MSVVFSTCSISVFLTFVNLVKEYLCYKFRIGVVVFLVQTFKVYFSSGEMSCYKSEPLIFNKCCIEYFYLLCYNYFNNLYTVCKLLKHSYKPIYAQGADMTKDLTAIMSIKWSNSLRH